MPIIGHFVETGQVVAIDFRHGNVTPAATNLEFTQQCEAALPQRAPISPLLSNIYMRQFIAGFKHFVFSQHYRVRIVNYADDFHVLAMLPATEMLRAVKRIMEALKLPVNGCESG